MWSLILPIHSNCTLHACDGYSCKVQRVTYLCISPVLDQKTTRNGITCMKWKLNYLTCFWNTRMKRHAWRREKKQAREPWKKGPDSCTEWDGGRGRGGGSGVRGGLQAERHVNAERRASLTRSLARHFLLTELPVQLLLCFSTVDPLPDPPYVFFLFFFCDGLNWLKFIVLRGEQLPCTAKLSILSNVFCLIVWDTKGGRQKVVTEWT